MTMTVAPGRNQPCSCGSGRKYKKCCADAHAALVTAAAGAGGTGAASLDLTKLVDAAVASDDWADVDELLAAARGVFERGAPLEHIRFRDDLAPGELDDADVARLCGGGWLARTEHAIVDALARYELEGPDERDGLRLAVLLLRRFGARARFVDCVLALQSGERIARAEALRDALRQHGITASAPGIFDPVYPMIATKHPPLLTFAQWFALILAGDDDDRLAARWRSGIAVRIAEQCLAFAASASAPPDDQRNYVLLAMVCARATTPELGPMLARDASLLAPTPTEQACYAQLTDPARRDELFPLEQVLAIGAACEQRDDFAGAALLRDCLRELDRHGRGR